MTTITLSLRRTKFINTTIILLLFALIGTLTAQTGQLIIDDFNDTARYNVNKINYRQLTTTDDRTLQFNQVNSGELKLQSAGTGYWYTHIKTDGYNVQSYRWLQLRMKGQNGGENCQLILKDINNKQYICNISDLISGGLTTSYQFVRLELDKATSIDISQLKSIVLKFQTQTTIFLDGIVFNGVGAKSMYVWSMDHATASTLGTFCNTYKISEIYLGCYNELYNNQNTLRTYITTLKDTYKIKKVYYLGGDPSWATTHRANASNRVAKVVNYNASSSDSAKFDGINFDVEFYLLSSWTGEPATVWQGYITMLEQCKTITTSANLQFIKTIPFWFDTNPNCSLFTVQSIVDVVAVMAYRDTAAGIINVSENEVAGGPAIVITETLDYSPAYITFFQESYSYWTDQIEQVILNNPHAKTAVHDFRGFSTLVNR